MSIWNQTLIVTRDVPAASAWYQQVLGATSGHGGDEYEQLLVGGELILQLHNLDVNDHHHGGLADPTVPFGNAVVLWFEVDDFDAAVARVRAAGAAGAAGAEILTEPQENPNSRQSEIWLRDLDGYRVVLCGPSPYRPR